MKQARPKLDEVIRWVVLARLKEFSGHRQRTANSLGISLRTLGLWLKKWKKSGLAPANI
jgi:DNA-binding NtrC family response regulator